MKELLFLLPYLVALIVISGYLQGEFWVFRSVIWVFLLVTVLDTFVGLDTQNHNDEKKRDLKYDLMRLPVCLWAPVEAVLILCGLMTVTNESITAAEAGATLVSVGMMSGMFGVSAAHELMHRSGRVERASAEMLMTMLSYTHFCIEHVSGHHRNVGTRLDPATARFGESFYAFYRRVLVCSLLSAWRLEVARLYRLRRPWLSLHNRMLRYLTTLTAIYAAIGWLFGWYGVAFVALQGVIGFSILEVINYIEHYGLTRREIAPGLLEPVLPLHSWNSSHRVSNWFLFNLARHSDHHYHANRPYQTLRHFGDAPQLPTGYFGMFVLALLPPLWRYVMDPRVEMWQLNRMIAATDSNVKPVGIIDALSGSTKEAFS